MSGDRDCGFELWRLDDNGNEFLVGRYADQASAQARLDKLSRGGHKQSYWIVSPARSPPAR